TRVDRGNERAGSFFGLRTPEIGIGILSEHRWVVGNRGDQSSVARSQKHSVDPWMCVKRRPEPLLAGRLRIRRIENPRHIRKGLIIIDDAAGPAQIIADEATD